MTMPIDPDRFLALKKGEYLLLKRFDSHNKPQIIALVKTLGSPSRTQMIQVELVKFLERNTKFDLYDEGSFFYCDRVQLFGLSGLIGYTPNTNFPDLKEYFEIVMKLSDLWHSKGLKQIGEYEQPIDAVFSHFNKRHQLLLTLLLEMERQSFTPDDRWNELWSELEIQ